MNGNRLGQPEGRRTPNLGRAGSLALAWIHQAAGVDDPWVTPRAVATSVRRVSALVAQGRLPASTVVDLARLTVMDWAVGVNHAIGTKRAASNQAVVELATRVSVDLGVPHLFRNSGNALIEFAARTPSTRKNVTDACLLAAATRAGTRIDEALHALNGTQREGEQAAAVPLVRAGSRLAQPAIGTSEGWKRAADRAVLEARAAVFDHSRHSDAFERAWRSVDEGGESTTDRILRRLDEIRSARSRPKGFEDQALNLVLSCLSFHTRRSGYLREAPRIASSAARHFNAVREGQEPALTTVDSARMILVDWALEFDHARADGYPFATKGVIDCAAFLIENQRLEDWLHQEGEPARSRPHQDIVRDAVRLAASFDRGTILDRVLHNANRSLVEEIHPVVRTRAAGEVDTRRGFKRDVSPRDREGSAWAERRAWEAKAAELGQVAAAAVAEHRANPPMPAPPILYSVPGGREGQPSDQVAELERGLGLPGELVVPTGEALASGAVAADSVRIISETFVESWGDGRLSPFYHFEGEGRAYRATDFRLAEGVDEGRDEARRTHVRHAAVIAEMVARGRSL